MTRTFPRIDAEAWPNRDVLADRAETTPDRMAVVDTDRESQLTFGELDVLVDHVSRQIAKRGESDGGRVVTLLNQSTEAVVVVHAAMRLGATLVPIDPSLSGDAIADRIERMTPDLLVCDATSEDSGIEVISRNAGDGPASTPADGTPAVCSVDPPQFEPVRQLSVPVDDWLHQDGDRRETPHPEVEPARIARDETVLVLFTSGTTGNPKGVRLTLGNLFSSATASAFRLGVGPGDRWLDCLPPYHMGGLAPVYRTALYGTTLVVQPGFETAATADVLDANDVTGVSFVPTHLARLLDSGWSPPDSLKMVLLGGAPASSGLLERALDRGVPVCPTYGLTETASQVATARPETARAHPDSVGQPLVCTRVTILDDGEPVEGTDTGEIVVDGPTVTPGYLDEERTERARCAYGFRTGDVGWRDEAGRVYVTGRLDDLIQTGGKLVPPATVEHTIRSLDGVSETVVLGVEDEEWGERVVALVVATKAVSEERSDDHCRDRLAGYKCPKAIFLVDELPRTPSGTVDREAARAMIAAADTEPR